MIPIISILLNQLHFLVFRDYLEILFFSTLIYYLSVWLAQDARKNLIVHFYGYCALIGIAYAAQLSSITFFLTFFAPVILMCFIIVHETTLQKNYVMLRNTNAPKKEARDWIEHLVRICLQNMNENRSLTCLIEQSDSLRSVLTAAMHLDVDLHTGILEMLVKAPTFSPEKIIWINKCGSLIGINTQWIHSTEQTFIDDSVKKLDRFKQDALLYTAKTDAVILRSDPVTHTFDIIAGGTLFESVSAHGVLTSLKTYLGAPSNTKKGDIHGTFTRKYNQKQPRT